MKSRSLAVAALVACLASAWPASAQSPPQPELEDVQRTIEFLEKNGGLDAHEGVRVFISTDLIDRFLTGLTPLSFKLSDNWGTFYILSAKSNFSTGIPKLSFQGRALAGGWIDLTVDIDAVIRLAETNNMSVGIISMRWGLIAIEKVPGGPLLLRVLTAQIAEAVDELNASLARQIKVPIQDLSFSFTQKIGEATVPFVLQSEKFDRAIQVRITQMVTLSNGVYIYGAVSR